MSLDASSAAELLNLLECGEVSSRQLVEHYLDKIQGQNDRLNVFLQIDGEAALDQADVIDRRRAAGEPLGTLAGLPVAVKDILCDAGKPTTCASRMLETFVPPYSATVVERIRAADGIVIGRTNLDEFAMGGSTENSAFGPTRNPWNPNHVPGGSSGGAAAAVAAGMAPLSLGTDTGGSIRQPAALCGVTGLKPTYGRVSRYGLVAFASSLDQIGPIAWSAEDAALLLQTLAGYDPHDSTSANEPTPDFRATLQQPLQGLKIGLVPRQWESGLDPDVEQAARQALQVLESLGATFQNVELPHSEFAVATYYIVASSEASGNLARYDGVHYGHRADERIIRAELEQEATVLRQKANDPGEAEAALAQLDSPLVRMYRKSRSEGFGPEVQRRVMLGTYALSAGYYDAYYLKALQVRRLIRQDYDAAFQQVDLIAGPVTTSTAFTLGEKTMDPLAMYLVDLFTVGANLAGIPAMSIPCGLSAAGLPIGLHLQGRPFSEGQLLAVGHQFQQSTDWHLQRPGTSIGDVL